MKKNQKSLRQQAAKMQNVNGFTLIELLIAFSITAILSAIGFASYSDYLHAQTLQTASDNVAAMLSLAKSRASIQVKPEQCGSSVTLEGYEVKISPIGIYSLIVRCNGNFTVQSKTLPKNVTVGSDSGTSFFFHVLTGAVDTASGNKITLNAYGKSKIITVDTNGNISTQ